jgi:molybdate transport system substrate-binding protein
MKKILFCILFVFYSLYGASINIAVAANMSYAIPQLIKEFNKQYPNIKIRTTIGSSGKLSAQIKHNAPYMIFLSANQKYPQKLYQIHKAITKPVVYAQGGLIYFSIKKIDFKKDGAFLTKNNIKKIAISNPKTAPYGKATIEAFKNMKIYNKIKHKFIYAQSISQAMSYALSATDIAVVAKSSIYSKAMQKYKQNQNWYEIDHKYYTPIKQAMVLLNKAKDNIPAQKFYDFLLSQRAKDILKNYGYIF